MGNAATTIVIAAAAAVSLSAGCTHHQARDMPVGRPGEDLGLALLEQERYDEALAVFNGVLDRDGEWHGALRGRGEALEALGYDEEALAAYERAARDPYRRPVEPAANSNYRINILRGNVLIKLERPNEALDAFDDALAMEPDDPGALHGRSRSLTALGRDEEALFVWADAEGIGEFARAVERNPVDAAAWAKLGIMFLGGGSHVQGLQCYQQAAALAPDNAEYQYFRAWLLAADGRLKESLAVFDIALALDPGNAAFYDKLGWVLGGAGRFEASMAAFERAAALDPDRQPSFDRARILMQFDRFAEALDALEIVIGKGATIRSVFRERGWCLHHLGRYDEALAAYDRAASFSAYGKPIEPWSMGCVDKVRFYRAQTLAVLGRYEEAIEEIDCFIEARPGFPGAEEIRREILAKLDGREEPCPPT